MFLFPTVPFLDISNLIWEKLNIASPKIKLKNATGFIKNDYHLIKSEYSLNELRDLFNVKNIRTVYHWFEGRSGIPLENIKILFSLVPKDKIFIKKFMKECYFYSGTGGRMGLCKLPLKLTTELSYLIGYFIADGSISKNGNINLTDSSKEHLDFISMILERQFKISKKPRKSGPNKYDIQFTSVPIRFYLQKIFNIPAGKKKGKTEIPELILNSQFEILRWFIIGFQDGDGYLPANNDKKHSIMLWQSSRKILDQIHMVLLKRNIKLKPPQNDGRDSYYLYVPRNNIYKYIKTFPFMHSEKRARSLAWSRIPALG